MCSLPQDEPGSLGLIGLVNYIVVQYAIFPMFSRSLLMKQWSVVFKIVASQPIPQRCFPSNE